MAKKEALRELQSRLAERLQAARTQQRGSSWLAVEVAGRGEHVVAGFDVDHHRDRLLVRRDGDARCGRVERRGDRARDRVDLADDLAGREVEDSDDAAMVVGPGSGEV